MEEIDAPRAANSQGCFSIFSFGEKWRRRSSGGWRWRSQKHPNVSILGSRPLLPRTDLWVSQLKNLALDFDAISRHQILFARPFRSGRRGSSLKDSVLDSDEGR